MAKIFKILEGKVTNVENGKTIKTVTYSYNCNKPLFETDDIDDAFDMFERMCEEGYRNDFIFIVDFGVMSLEQAMRCKHKKNMFGCDNKITDVLPYLNIGEYHYNHPSQTGYNEQEIHVRDTRFDRPTESAYEALSLFFNLVRKGIEVSIDVVEYMTKGNNEKLFKRERRLIDNELLRKVGRRSCKGSIKIDVRYKKKPNNPKIVMMQ